MLCDFCKTKEAIKVEPDGMFTVRSGVNTIRIAMWKSDATSMTPLVACHDCMTELVGRVENTSCVIP